MKRAKLQYAIMSNQEVINYIKLVRTWSITKKRSYTHTHTHTHNKWNKRHF
jgi:hypothetical protein